MCEQTQKYYESVYATKAILDNIPFDLNRSLQYLSGLDHIPAEFLNPLQHHLIILGCYALDERVRYAAAKVGVRLYNTNIQTYLQLCCNAGVYPEEVTAECPNLLILCPNIPIKYRQQEVEVYRAESQINTLGWDIDEIVYFICQGSVSWKFALLQTQSYEGKGFPRSCCIYVNCDLFAQTVLAEMAQDLGYDDAICYNVLANVMKLLFIKDPNEFYVRYVYNYMAHSPATRFIGAAWHCVAMIQQRMYPQQYYFILKLLLQELNKTDYIPTDVSFYLQEVLQEIYAFKFSELNILMVKHANIDWTLKALSDILKYTTSLQQLTPLLLAICQDGRFHLYEQFFGALLKQQQPIYSTFEPCFESIDELLAQQSFSQLYKQLLQPYLEFLKSAAGAEFRVVQSYKDFKKNAKMDLKLQIHPIELMQRFSVLAIYVQSFHTRPVNMVQWFGSELETEKSALLTGFSAVYCMLESFIERAKQKFEGYQRSEAKKVHYALRYSIERFVGAYLGVSIDLKLPHLHTERALPTNKYMALYAEHRKSPFDKHDLAIFTAHATFLSDKSRALKLLRKAAPGPFSASAAVLLTYLLNDLAIAQTYEGLAKGCEDDADFNAFCDFYVTQMPSEFYKWFGKSLSPARQFDQLLYEFDGSASWVERITCLLRDISFARAEHALLALEAFNLADDLPRHLRISTRLALLDRVIVRTERFVQYVAFQMCEQLFPEERAAYRSLTAERPQEFYASLQAMLSGFE